MKNHKSIMSTIVDYIKTKVNNFCFSRLQASGSFNPDDAYWQMQEYGYADLGEYARQSFIGRLFSRKASF